MRGTCKSEGNFSVWRKDGEDAYDTFAWIVKQPWSNGKVFTAGGSADGIAQFVQPLALPPNLVAQFSTYCLLACLPACVRASPPLASPPRGGLIPLTLLLHQ